MTNRTRVRIDRHYRDEDAREALATDVREGLTSTPKALPPKWLYDDAGSDLFEQITRLPEYYPTRCEREILRARAEEIAAATRASTLVELGSGSSEKTRLLLDALAGAGTLERYVPIDVSDGALIAAAESITEDYPDLEVHGVVADFEVHLDLLPAAPSRLVVFLGGTIGNFEPAPRGRFLRAVARTLRPGDAFLLGTDLVKDARRLVRAYDDSAGVTAAFDRNVLNVVNRELGGDFDNEQFEHVAVWDADEAWIEMRLRSLRDQSVRVKALDLEVEFIEGEEMRTEISAKFTRERVEQELANAGLRHVAWWTDLAGDFALSLAVPRQPADR